MMYEVIEMADGTEVDSESGPISLHCEPADSSGEVHIESPGGSVGEGKCAVSGNTYHRKDLIKKLPYGDDGTEWTGETWIVDSEQTANLAAVLCIAGVDVTIDSEAVGSDAEWGYYHEQESEDDEDGGDVVIGEPDDANESKVMVSWVCDLVEVGCCESELEYKDRYGVELFWDDDVSGSHELLADTDGLGVFDTRKACPT